MEVILLAAGCLSIGGLIGYIISNVIHKRIVKDWLVGRLNVVWDHHENQPYMFMELANPDISDITNRKYITLQVKNEIEDSQK